MNFLDNYSSASLFDEMLDDQLRVREHWQPLLERLEAMSSEELENKQAEIAWHLEDNGVTYNVYNDPEDNGNRPWSLDPIPFIITKTEWKEIRRGIKQRAKLFNLILKDLYGEQKLLKENIIPAEVIYGHKGFIPAVHSLGLMEDFQLYFYALDMARGPDGKMWVINDRTQAPSGLGYAVENRLTMNIVSKDLYPEHEIKKLLPFIDEFKKLLKKLSKGDISKAALLTPGPHNETYFEHAYLSSFLEINLVEGDDLLSKNGALWLKSLSGLKPINTILRRLDDRFCDPLELLNDSKLGVAGLVDSLRAGNLAMINPIGSAIVENIGLNPFMERICHYFLNEELLLPQIATWWCGQSHELEYVLEHFDSLIIKKIDRTEAIQTHLVKKLSNEMRMQLKNSILQNPHQYVAQEEISFSTTPFYADGKIEPRNAVVRAFALKKNENYTVMNGGLVRVSTSKDALLVSSQKGGTSKDLWILGEDETIDMSSIFNTLPYVDVSIHTMPTRKAENLFWLGRYLCRTITTIRLIRYVVKKMTNFSRYEGALSRESQLILEKSLTHLTMTYPGFLDEKIVQNQMNEIESLIKDKSKQGGLSFTMEMLFNANASIKSLLAIEAWKLFDKMQKEWKVFTRKVNSPTQTILSELDKFLLYLVAYKELVEESMYKEQGLILYDIGYKLESALLTISKARSMLCVKHEKSASYDILEGMLNSCESFNAYRTQYKSSLQLDNVLEFLMLSPQFPKSIAYITNELLEDLKALPKSKKYLSSYEEPIFQAYSALKLTNVATLLQIEEGGMVYKTLDEFLATLTAHFSLCSMELSKTYFSHYDE